MVEKAKVIRPITSTGRPMPGIMENAWLVSTEPSPDRPSMWGYLMMQLTSTRPVIRQMMTVSQNVPVMETSAWRLGLRVFAAEATSGAEPMPDSLEKSPRAKP